MTAAGGRARPLGRAEFAALMQPLGPFETAPELAVAVSGGRDSLALALLAQDWAVRRGGRVLALTVDHRLRPESGDEARQVSGWLAARGIRHRVLAWTGAKPATGLQAAARRARYGLLETACRRHGILHLLLAHQQRDQLATYLMRRAHASGPDGLAAMAAVRLEGGVRLLRPLLAIGRARLTATLEVRGQPWIDDPSNLDPGFERTRIERGLPAPAARAGIGRELAAAGRARAARERALAELAAEAVVLAPAGFALVAPGPALAAPGALRRALFGRLLMTVGGRPYPPPGARLARFVAGFEAAGAGFRGSLGGCRALPWRGRLLVVRELRRPPAPLPLRTGGAGRWDRFECRLAGAPARPLTVAMLGAEGWRRLRADGHRPPAALPAAARAGLPALFDGDLPLAVPQLGYCRAGQHGLRFSALFRPAQPLVPAPFAVASPAGGTI